MSHVDVKFKAIYALILCLFIGSLSHAQQNRQQQEIMMGGMTQYRSVLGYSISSDALDQSDQTLLNQGIRYTGTYFFNDRKLFTAFGLGASYQSVDNELVQNDNGSFNVSDLSISLGTAGWNIYVSKADKVALFTSVNNVVPLSERSRNEGYKSVSTLSSSLVYRRGPFDVGLSGRYSYVFNSYETNTFGLYNLESSTAAGVSLGYNYKRFSFQYSYRFGVLQYADGNRLGSSGNNFSITGIINKNFWASLSTSNLSYADEQYVDVWFYDPYSRIYSLNMGVTF